MERDSDTYPEGLDYLRLIDELENICAEQTISELPNLGKSAPVCYWALGTTLSRLERVASCGWNCPGGGADNHAVHYLVGRSSSFLTSALRLGLRGRYDESLSLLRSVGETANLLQLFRLEANSLAEWISTDDRGRWREFKPEAVRKKIEEFSVIPVMPQSTYRKLCGLVTHPNPSARANRFDHRIEGGTNAPRFQDIGLFVCLNETLYIGAQVLAFSAHLAEVPEEISSEIDELVEGFLEIVGGVRAENYQEALDEAARIQADLEADQRTED